MDEICRISSWNPPDFICKWGNLHMKSAGFHGNSPDFTMKSARFHHEIRRISWIVDFAVFFCKTNTDIHERTRSTTECCIFFIRTKVLGMKSAEFHEIRHEICHEICRISYAKDFGSDEKNTAFSGRSSPFMYICIGFAEKYSKIHYSWNPADFMVKSGRFHGEIWWISMKSGGFHMQIASFAYEIWRISYDRFHDGFHEIRQISYFPNEPRTNGPIFVIFNLFRGVSLKSVLFALRVISMCQNKEHGPMRDTLEPTSPKKPFVSTNLQSAPWNTTITPNDHIADWSQQLGSDGEK